MNLFHLTAAHLSALAVARVRSERGATAVEYGLMVTLIAVVIVGAVSIFGTNVSKLFLIPAGVFDKATP